MIRIVFKQIGFQLFSKVDTVNENSLDSRKLKKPNGISQDFKYIFLILRIGFANIKVQLNGSSFGSERRDVSK